MTREMDWQETIDEIFAHVAGVWWYVAEIDRRMGLRLNIPDDDYHVEWRQDMWERFKNSLAKMTAKANKQEHAAPSVDRQSVNHGKDK